jgi:elongation factor G
VDSSELAFKIAAQHAFAAGFLASKPAILEPIMRVEVSGPHEYQGTIVALVNKRKGQMQGSESTDMFCSVQADVPLASMFGFSTDLRSSTQGKGEFTMEYLEHQHVGHWRCLLRL